MHGERSGMGILKLFFVVVRSLLLSRAGLAAENLALRRQLAVLRRKVKRPKITRGDRLFWFWLSRLWTGWRSTLAFVEPETVFRWHREGHDRRSPRTGGGTSECGLLSQHGFLPQHGVSIDTPNGCRLKPRRTGAVINSTGVDRRCGADPRSGGHSPAQSAPSQVGRHCGTVRSNDASRSNSVFGRTYNWSG